MGIFGFIKGQFIDVIEWVDSSRNTLIFKFPDKDKEIKMGAQLTVRESQAALLINEGKIADVYPPGRHELVTRNMPILTSLKSWKTGFDSPFKVDCYYVNTRKFTARKWGTPSPIYIPDAKFEQIEVRAFGSYDMRITDPKMFFTEFAGTDPVVTIEEFEPTLRNKLVDQFTEVVAEIASQGLSFVELQANKSEFSKALGPRIESYFASFGVELTDFTIQSITLPPEVNEFLRKNTQMNMVKDLDAFTQFQQAKALEEAAKSGGSIAQPGMDMASMMMANMMMENMKKDKPKDEKSDGGSDSMSRDEIMKTLKELGDLKKEGIITPNEFDKKKTELLARL